MTPSELLLGLGEDKNMSEHALSCKTESFIRLETNGEDRLHCDYAIMGLDDVRKNILLRRGLSALSAEEKRIYSLTDAQALAELDALKAAQDHCVQTDPALFKYHLKEDSTS